MGRRFFFASRGFLFLLITGSPVSWKASAFSRIIPAKLVLDLIGERESRGLSKYTWIPACAGMTKKKHGRDAHATCQVFIESSISTEAGPKIRTGRNAPQKSGRPMYLAA